MSKEKDEEYSDPRPEPPAKDRFPRIVIIIILAEFCERFSFSGMRGIPVIVTPINYMQHTIMNKFAQVYRLGKHSLPSSPDYYNRKETVYIRGGTFLTLYLRSKLGYTDDGATETYHVFSTFVYVFPIIGGVLADNYLGKFRTILYLMFVYAAGNILVAITAIPQLALPARLCTLLGLLMITIGTGGIKPCVTAFGGDQFKLPQQDHHLAIYFSILYANIATGSLIAKTVSPILRSEVHCFGAKDCYSLAFGAPGLIVLVSIVIFVSAKRWYVLKNPEGNVLLDFIKCVSIGLKNLALRRSGEKDDHWLDSARHAYDTRFIRDVKKTMSILMLFTVLPIFWSLLDQMGSRWTLQATKMDGRFGFLTIKPDQMQVLNPIIILIFIPLSQKYIYPFVERRNILKNPLHKLTLGGILAGVAFIVAGIVETYLRTTYPHLPQPNYSQIRIFNGNPCPVSLYSDHQNITYTIPSLSHFVKKDIRVNGIENITLELGGSCIQSGEYHFLLEENAAISFFMSKDNVYRFKDGLEKSRSGFPIVRFLVSENINAENIRFMSETKSVVEAYVSPGVGKQIEVFADTYSIHLSERRPKEIGQNTMDPDDTVISRMTGNNGTIGHAENVVSGEPNIESSVADNNVIVSSNMVMESGGVYTIILVKNEHGYNTNTIVITEANSISMALLVPQFLIMSIAEVLFAVTGNEFAFKESPESMKAVMTAVWLLTEAVGNVIIIVITRLLVNYRQDIHFFFYTGLMFVSITVFHFLSRGYQLGHGADTTPKKERRSDSEVLYLQVRQTEDCLDH